MLTILGRGKKLCDGINRREFLKVGGFGLGGLTLADLLRLQAQGAEPANPSPKAVIMVVLFGGVSHIDTYDMKPEAPSEIRSEFRSIQTNVPGISICELMPLQAKIADKLAIIRSFRAFQGNHWLHELVTGSPSDNRDQNQRPPFGSIVSRLHPRGDLPNYVSLTKLAGSANPAVEEPGYAGTAHRPFRPEGESLANLRLNSSITLERLGERRALLDAFDNLRRQVDVQGEMLAMDAFTARALDMIASPKVRDAFDISREPNRVRDMYGGLSRYRDHLHFEATYNGDLFLQARRLVEAGVPVVTLQAGFWDHHDNIFNGLRALLPLLDRSIHALVSDLHQRGLDNDVAVVFWGEMGRQPRIDPRGSGRGVGPGRHHHLPAGSFVMAGGGLRMGQVIGATDARGDRPTTRPIGPQNVLATLYHVLGIDPAATLPDHQGRPVHLLDDREKIRELV